MDKNSIEKLTGKTADLGSMKSRDLGNLMSKSLTEYGKELAIQASKDGNVDFGNLPSKALPNLGKLVVENNTSDPGKVR